MNKQFLNKYYNGLKGFKVESFFLNDSDKSIEPFPTFTLRKGNQVLPLESSRWQMSLACCKVRFVNPLTF